MNKNTKRAILGILAAALTALGAYWGFDVDVQVTEMSGTIQAPAQVSGDLQ